jgi:hypothetical protein
VPLGWAHEHGAWRWSWEKRHAFANDLDNLIAVARHLNQSKGARGPMEWMPPKEAFWCEYLERWNVVLERYGLEYEAAEQAATKEVLATCAGEAP